MNSNILDMSESECDYEEEVSERSFIVIDLKDKGTLRDDLIKFGLKYEQDSITYAKKDDSYYLISTNKCPNAYPGKGKLGVEKKIGKALFGEKGEIYSKVNGRPFVFKEAIGRSETIKDYHPTEIRSLKAMADGFFRTKE